MSGAEPTDFDIAIVGGGLTGLALAGLLDAGLQSAGCELRIALIETRPPQPAAADAELDLRVSALSQVSRAVLEQLGIWQQLPADRVSPYRRMCVWQEEGIAGGERSITFDAAEIGAADLGHIVENRAVLQCGWKLIENSERITLITGQELVAVSEATDHCTLETAAGDVLTARLLIGADGANSVVRRNLDVEFPGHAYGQAGLVAHIQTAEPHGETAWQRFLADGPVALLPLADGRSSLVWSCPEERARALIDMDVEAFEQELADALGHALGAVECTSPRASFPLTMGYAGRYTGRRFALVGDAAHRVHPLAGQGANLGLLDAAVLADCLLTHLQQPLADPGDPLVLRRYERARKGDNLITMRSMDLLNRLFASPLARVAGDGMQWIDGMAPLKNRFARYAMGLGRDLPAATQPAVD